MDSGKKVICSWYKITIETGTILNVRGCVPLQYKRNIIEGTVHRAFRSTTTWEDFDQALEKNWKQWIENQYPKNWSDRVVIETLNKIIEGNKNLEVKASEPRNNIWLKDSPPSYNAISRQSISTVICKGSANIRGTNNFYKKKIENTLAIPQNFLGS